MSDADAIVNMINAGGVYYNICGDTPEKVFADAITQLELPEVVDPQLLYAQLCEREGLMTTSIGNGIALPHPRTTMVTNPLDQRIFVCFLDRPVNFDAMDGQPVSVLFLILSVDSKTHLSILSRLSYLFQIESFLSFLHRKPNTAELVNEIRRNL